MQKIILSVVLLCVCIKSSFGTPKAQCPCSSSTSHSQHQVQPAKVDAYFIWPYKAPKGSEELLSRIEELEGEKGLGAFNFNYGPLAANQKLIITILVQRHGSFDPTVSGQYQIVGDGRSANQGVVRFERTSKPTKTGKPWANAASWGVTLSGPLESTLIALRKMRKTVQQYRV